MLIGRTFLEDLALVLGVAALTTVLFASEHSLWFSGLIAGIAYNWLYVRTGNLWIPIAAHAPEGHGFPRLARGISGLSLVG